MKIMRKISVVVLVFYYTTGECVWASPGGLVIRNALVHLLLKKNIDGFNHCFFKPLMSSLQLPEIRLHAFLMMGRGFFLPLVVTKSSGSENWNSIT